jgi:hypothetical protein
MCQVKQGWILGLSTTILGGGLIARKAELNFQNGGQDTRNPEKYHFSLSGMSSNAGTSCWLVEGHHLSQNYVSHPLENATHNSVRSDDDCHEAG